MAMANPDLKITDIKAYPTSFPVKPGDSVSLGVGRAVKRDAIIVKVTTAGGLVGWGESHHGRAPGESWFEEVAFKYMPFNVQAALGYAQFLRLDELVARKRWILDGYKKGLADIDDILFNPEPAHVFNSAWCSTLVFGKSTGLTRDSALAILGEQGLPTRQIGRAHV